MPLRRFAMSLARFTLRQCRAFRNGNLLQCDIVFYARHASIFALFRRWIAGGVSPLSPQSTAKSSRKLQLTLSRKRQYPVPQLNRFAPDWTKICKVNKGFVQVVVQFDFHRPLNGGADGVN
jgi:hypothetical protein